MAAATVTGAQQNNVVGARIYRGADSIVFASNGDTWDTGLNDIDAIWLTPTTEEAFGFTVSGGTLTLVNTNAPVTFRGGVLGNF